MADINQFGSGVPGDAQVCARCEALLMDALDHTASPEDQAFFDRHLGSCVSCSRMFIDAKRGAAWLEMLRDPRPEPSATLFHRILAQTSGTPTSAAHASGIQTSGTQTAAQPGTQPAPAPSLVPLPSSPVLPAAAYPAPAKVLPFHRVGAPYTFTQRMLQPRLAMTAAMAFFSIALTLNLTGVHLSELRAGDLRPSSIRRGFHQANAHVVRYYDNLRVVYELEARVHDLQHTADTSADDTADKTEKAPSAGTPDKSGAPQPQQAKPPRKPGAGTSLREPLLPKQEDEQDERQQAVAQLATPELEHQPHAEGDRS